MTAQRQRRGGFIVSVVGLVLVILGVLWLAVIFPSLDKVPTGYERTLYFEGDFTVGPPGNSTNFPIEQILEQKANDTQDGALFINERYIVKNAATGMDISAYYGIEQTLAIDRHTLQIVTDVDERHRSGYWGPPRGLGKGDSFDLWNPGANQALTASYVRDDTFREMKVVIFEISAQDISIGTDPQSQLPLLLSTVITLTIDPRTGTVVDQDSTTTTSMDMMGQKIPVQISNVRYAESTIVDLMGVANDGARKLLLFETVVPCVLIGVGAVLVIIDTVFIGRKRVAKV